MTYSGQLLSLLDLVSTNEVPEVGTYTVHILRVKLSVPLHI